MDVKDTNHKAKYKKKKRVIIRNLSFKVNEKELRKIFSKFGEVVDVTIPLKKDGKKRGFGFVEFNDMKSLIRSIKALNYKDIHGRKVAIDFALGKTEYLKTSKNTTNISKKESDSHDSGDHNDSKDDSSSESHDEEDENIIEEENNLHKTSPKKNDLDKEKDERAEAFLRYFNSEVEHTETEDSEASSDENDSDSDNTERPENFKKGNDQEDLPTSNKSQKKGLISRCEPSFKKPRRESNDVSEGKTVFLRNISFNTNQDHLKKAVEQYGVTDYCLLCIDPLTDHPKGTGFVKFKEKSSADSLIEASSKDPGFILDGRSILCTQAVSHDEVSHLHDKDKKKKDKRNLALVKVGLIMPNSEESEGVSPLDMAKRLQLEKVRKQKLKNVNFFVSNVRLAIHNLPQNFTDAKLRKIFKMAAGKGAVITEARVMKEFKKTDAKGNPVSKGFGFVSFSEHEHALKALNELNNNPKVFHPNKRPIVEFSIENKLALLSREKKIEKIQMRNKRRTEEKRARILSDEKSSGCELQQGKKKKAINKIKKDEEENYKLSTLSPNKSKKKRNKSKKNKKSLETTLKQKEKALQALKNKYKEKLMEKV